MKKKTYCIECGKTLKIGDIDKCPSCYERIYKLAQPYYGEYKYWISG